MFYVVTDNKVYSGKDIKTINKVTNGKFDLSEFKVCGPDHIVTATDKDLVFIADKRRLSMIPIERLSRKDNSSKSLLILILVFTIIGVIRG